MDSKKAHKNFPSLWTIAQHHLTESFQKTFKICSKNLWAICTQLQKEQNIWCQRFWQSSKKKWSNDSTGNHHWTKKVCSKIFSTNWSQFGPKVLAEKVLKRTTEGNYIAKSKAKKKGSADSFCRQRIPELQKKDLNHLACANWSPEMCSNSSTTPDQQNDFHHFFLQKPKSQKKAKKKGSQ